MSLAMTVAEAEAIMAPTIAALEAENARLRDVVEAARALMDDFTAANEKRLYHALRAYEAASPSSAGHEP